MVLTVLFLVAFWVGVAWLLEASALALFLFGGFVAAVTVFTLSLFQGSQR